MLKKIFSNIERVFLLSPIILTFSILFNFHDAKFLISRTIILVSLYCLFFYKENIVREVKSKFKVIFISLLACSYFFLMQLLNEGNSDLPRSILFVLLYFTLVPTSLFSKNILFYLAWLGCVSSGVLALYEVYWLGVTRVGLLALNPIPFAYYSGLSLIVVLGTFSSLSLGSVDKFKLACLAVALPLAAYAVILSQTRATYLSLVVMSLFYVTHLIIKKPTKKNIIITSLLVMLISTLLWQIDDIKLRVIDAYNQIQGFSHNNYYSSTGIRVKLWEAGLRISQDSFFFGQSKSEISLHTMTLIDDGVVPSYLKQFLVHPNPNFHNQFIQTLADSGVIGLSLILTFILVPMLIKSNSLKVLGVYISSYTVICLWFDSMFLYNHTVILYVFILLIFYSIAINDNKQGEEK